MSLERQVELNILKRTFCAERFSPLTTRSKILLADDISDSSLLGKGFVGFVFVWFMSSRLTTIS